MKTLPITACCLTLTLLASCSRPKEPQFRRLSNVELAGADFADSTIRLKADAVFHNPNGIRLDVTALELSVALDGVRAATVKQGATAGVPANADFTLPVQVEIPLKIVMEALEDEGGSVLGGLVAGKLLDVEVDGWVRVRLRGIEMQTPIHHVQQVELKL